MLKGWVISIAICYSFAVNAQSVRGKIVYVSPSQPVQLKFGSRIVNYSFMEHWQAGLYKIHSSGKNLTISKTPGDFKEANLVIKEGNNSHLFMLKYKDPLDETSYDLSTTEKLNAEVQNLRMVLNNAAAREAFDKHTVSISVFSSENTNESAFNTSKTETGSASAPVPKSEPLPNKASAPKTESLPKNEPVFKPQPIPTNEPEASNTPNTYETLIHLADSTAWTAKNFKASLHLYDSARKINPTATYPNKQIAAVKKMINDQLTTARQQRSQNFNAAMADYKSADALRVERKFEEAYKGYNKFLSQIDTKNIKDYQPSELHFINQANDYLVRLQPYLPKPKLEVTPPPPDKTKKKKRKKN